MFEPSVTNFHQMQDKQKCRNPFFPTVNTEAKKGLLVVNDPAAVDCGCAAKHLVISL